MNNTASLTETIENGNGDRVWYFTGTCTVASHNDSIRRTGYNGGRYSWRQGEQLTKSK